MVYNRLQREVSIGKERHLGMAILISKGKLIMQNKVKDIDEIDFFLLLGLEIEKRAS